MDYIIEKQGEYKMKDLNELLKRAIILVCLSDRCAQEKNVVGGISRPFEARKQQCEAICVWLKKMGYMDDATDEERNVFEKELHTSKDDEILRLQIDYECIEPILWTVGLVEKMSNYDLYVFTDFHPALCFGREHSLEKLIPACKIVSAEQFDEKREEAMLVYWRCLEAKSEIINEKGLDKSIGEVFGAKYVETLLKMEMYDDKKKDFIVNNKEISELAEAELSRLSTIAERRFYAFEWMAGDEKWDSVDLVC